MRPKMKISRLTNLQDARYSAAVGFDFISFSLERGHNNKLPLSMIMEMASWVSGPEIVLELNGESLDELDGLKEGFEFMYISVPIEDRGMVDLDRFPAIIFRVDGEFALADLERVIEDGKGRGQEVMIEMELGEDMERYSSIMSNLWLNFPAIDGVSDFLKDGESDVFAISLRDEAKEEDGWLNYEALDELMEGMGVSNC